MANAESSHLLANPPGTFFGVRWSRKNTVIPAQAGIQPLGAPRPALRTGL